MANNIDITVLMPTYNRANDLRETLGAMTRLDRSGLSVEFVVIDNNSTDDTKTAIESFTDRLPIHRLHQPLPGKNRALNLALEEAELAPIVLFTDDDITPQEDWLQAVAATAARWPHHSVFGGRVRVVYPTDEIPDWCKIPFIRKFAHTEHDCGDTEHVYEEEVYPFGPNYWVRREVLEGGRRFKENLGPQPVVGLLGDEIQFLRNLRDDGYVFVYSPGAVVGHRVQPEMLRLDVVKRRAYKLGKSSPHVGGFCRPELLEMHPFLWKLLRVSSLVKNLLALLLATVTPSEVPRVERSVLAIMRIAYNIESLKLANRRWKRRT
jgi:glycosyltransferase involved in cell wall biosynthesis